jgi:hypothetical protein
LAQCQTLKKKKEKEKKHPKRENLLIRKFTVSPVLKHLGDGWLECVRRLGSSAQGPSCGIAGSHTAGSRSTAKSRDAKEALRWGAKPRRSGKQSSSGTPGRSYELAGSPGLPDRSTWPTKTWTSTRRASGRVRRRRGGTDPTSLPFLQTRKLITTSTTPPWLPQVVSDRDKFSQPPRSLLQLHTRQGLQGPASGAGTPAGRARPTCGLKSETPVTERGAEGPHEAACPTRFEG